MYEIDEEIKTILEAHGISIKSRLDELNLKSVVIDCPRCGSKTRASFDPDVVSKRVPGTGIANVVVKLPCSHEFVLHISKDLKVRGLEEIDKGILVTTERLDIRFIKEQMAVLEDLHSRLVKEERDDLQYKVFAELSRLRKAISSLDRRD